MTDRFITHVAWIALAAAVTGAAVCGCGRDEEVGDDYDLGPPPVTAMSFKLASTIETGMKGLKGIALGPAGEIYCCGDGGVRVLDSSGKLIASWKTESSARCIALSPAGAVYVGLKTKIEIYDAKGNRTGGWGREGKERGDLAFVTGLCITASEVYVADAGNRVVHRFGTDGELINEIGRKGESGDELGIIVPSPHLDCFIDSEGMIVLNNLGRRLVQRYNPTGRLISEWGKAGFDHERFCGCCNPTDIARMTDDRVVTSEKGLARVKVYDKAGNMLAYIPRQVFSEKAQGIDLAVDSKGRIFAADPVKGTVLVFEKDRASPLDDEADIR